MITISKIYLTTDFKYSSKDNKQKKKEKKCSEFNFKERLDSEIEKLKQERL